MSCSPFHLPRGFHLTSPFRFTKLLSPSSSSFSSSSALAFRHIHSSLPSSCSSSFAYTGPHHQLRRVPSFTFPMSSPPKSISSATTTTSSSSFSSSSSSSSPPSSSASNNSSSYVPHSRGTVGCLTSRFEVITIPMFSDNYAYFLVDTSTRSALVVDPSQPSEVLRVAEKEKIDLHGILTTHHHNDHAGGNAELMSKKPSLIVYGADDRIPLTKKVEDGELIQFHSLQIRVISTPCHTRGSVSYFVTDSSDPSFFGCVFTGDTLFLSGCGRFFEGTADQMYTSLIEKLSALPPETLVYCGHEYAEQNLKFALSVEPDNGFLLERMQYVHARREQGLPTVPGKLSEEFNVNPFMRVKERALAKRLGFMEWAAKKESYIATMAALRQRKDHFKA